MCFWNHEHTSAVFWPSKNQLVLQFNGANTQTSAHTHTPISHCVAQIYSQTHESCFSQVVDMIKESAVLLFRHTHTHLRFLCAWGNSIIQQCLSNSGVCGGGASGSVSEACHCLCISKPPLVCAAQSAGVKSFPSTRPIHHCTQISFKHVSVQLLSHKHTSDGQEVWTLLIFSMTSTYF